MFLCIGAVLLAVVASWLHKMIGVEVLQVFQVCRFLQVLLRNKQLYYSTMGNFELINRVVGVLTVIGSGVEETSKDAYRRLGMTTDFFYNYQVVLLVQAVAFSLYVMVKIFTLIRGKDEHQEVRPPRDIAPG